MRAILLNDRRAERDAMLKALARSECRVEPVNDERTAMEAISRERCDVVIFSAPSKGAVEFVRRLRCSDRSGHAYLIAIVEASPTQAELSALLSAGTQDFVRRPLVDAELFERVKAPSRLQHWLKSVEAPAAYDFSAPPELSQLRAWRTLGTTVGEDLGQVAGKCFAVREGWPSGFTDSLRGATIPMSLAGDQLEVRVSICADTSSRSWVRTVLLGDQAAHHAAVDDVLREFANTAGGALKRTALTENITLTTGIPFNAQPKRSAQTACWTLEPDDGNACFALMGEIIRRQNQRVRASSLCEGMVIVYDVRSEGGVLLVTGGSRLTSTAAAKLSNILGPRTFVEVAPAA